MAYRSIFVLFLVKIPKHYYYIDTFTKTCFKNILRSPLADNFTQ